LIAFVPSKMTAFSGPSVNEVEPDHLNLSYDRFHADAMF
jgi:hypothetical protein